MDPTYPLVPIANFIACALTVIPLFHMVNRSWNMGVFVFALWLFLISFTTALNAIIWSSDAKDRAPVLCDISSHIAILADIGGPACSFVITRRLSKISRLRAEMISRRQKRIELLLELFICFGIPIAAAILYYIVQGARYQVVEELGCDSAEIVSGLSIILIDSWSVIFPFISLVYYAPRIIYTFYRHRREMNDHLNSADTEPSQSDFFRVFALGCFDAFITLPISITALITGSAFEGPDLNFYQGWSSIHSDWEPILLPKRAWSMTKLGILSVHWNEWLNPFIALVFFSLFGLTPEARKGYRRFFRFLRKPFGARQGECTEEGLPDVVFKCRRGTNTTAMSNISSSSPPADDSA